MSYGVLNLIISPQTEDPGNQLIKHAFSMGPDKISSKYIKKFTPKLRKPIKNQLIYHHLFAHWVVDLISVTVVTKAIFHLL